MLIFNNTSFNELSLVVPSLNSLILLIAVGITATISHLFVVYGLKFSPATTIAPILYLEIVSASVLGYFVFSDIRDIFTIIGVLIIIMCGIYVFLRDHEQNINSNKIIIE